jgi:glycerol-3-phosphate O-acyltransferase
MAQNASNALFRFNRERQDIIEEVVDRVTRAAITQSWRSPEHGLEYLLNEAAFHEMSAFEEADALRSQPEAVFWRDVVQRVRRAGEEENAELLRSIVLRCSRDIAGHFRPGVYHFATRVLPPSVSLLFGRQSLSSLLTLQPRLDSLREKVLIEGELGKLRQVAQGGTLLIVPTHSSHMDSLLMGWALNECGLPPVTYGAGRNLFQNPITSFFMQNLGAWKVDRRKRYTVYKSVLKTYSQILLERGFHSLFFPAGGRSRSNRVEERLKLGLLGTALGAYTANVIQKRPHPRVFVVPVTLNYNLVLEAETLVDEHLKQHEVARPIIEDDEFADVRRVAHFVSSALDMDTAVTVRFGTPMDVFGNLVDLDGESMDSQGRRIDPERYLWVQGQPQADAERDRQYTRILGERIAASWKTNNVIHPLHIVSFAIFEHIRRQHPHWDLYRTLRFSRGDALALPIAEGETERLIRIVRRDADEGRFRLSRGARALDARGMVDEALRLWRTFHAAPVAVAEDGQLRLLHLKLLYFYSNRLRGYELERRLRSPGGYG